MPHCLAMDARKTLLDKIEAYLSASGVSARQFGIDAVNDHKLVGRLRARKGVTLTTIERVEAFMRSNAPAKVKAA